MTEPAYVVPVRDGRDTVELIETQAAELKALREYLAAQNASLEQIAKEFETLETAVADERAAWKAEADRQKGWGKLILGLIIGGTIAAVAN